MVFKLWSWDHWISATYIIRLGIEALIRLRGINKMVYKIVSEIEKGLSSQKFDSNESNQHYNECKFSKNPDSIWGFVVILDRGCM